MTTERNRKESQIFAIWPCQTPVFWAVWGATCSHIHLQSHTARCHLKLGTFGSRLFCRNSFPPGKCCAVWISSCQKLKVNLWSLNRLAPCDHLNTFLLSTHKVGLVSQHVASACHMILICQLTKPIQKLPVWPLKLEMTCTNTLKGTDEVVPPGLHIQQIPIANVSWVRPNCTKS